MASWRAVVAWLVILAEVQEVLLRGHPEGVTCVAQVSDQTLFCIKE